MTAANFDLSTNLQRQAALKRIKITPTERKAVIKTVSEGKQERGRMIETQEERVRESAKERVEGWRKKNDKRNCLKRAFRRLTCGA